MNYHILIRTPGNVLHSFYGSHAAAIAKCDEMNATDEQGSTCILSSQENEMEHRAEFERLNG